MKMTERVDIEAPAEFVFGELSDFPTIERLAIQRGVALRRADRLDERRAGMAWIADWEFGGRKRRTNLTLTRYEPPRRMVLASETSGIAAEIEIEVVPLAATASRVLIETQMTAESMAAKLLLQTVRLGRAAFEGRIRGRLSNLAARVEQRYAASTGGAA